MSSNEQGFCAYCQKVTLQEITRTRIGKTTVRVEVICSVCHKALSLKHITGVIISTTEGEEVFQGYRGFQ